MADFIIAAYRRSSAPADLSALISAMRDEDSRYDHDALDRKLDQRRRDLGEY